MNPFLSVLGHSFPAYQVFWVLSVAAFCGYVLVINQLGVAGKLPFIDIVIFTVGFSFSAYYGSMAMSYIVNFFTYNASSVDSFDTLIAALGRTGAGHLYYGGVIAVGLFLLVFCRVFKVRRQMLLGIIAPGGALFMSVFRIGCFNAGCCYGIPSYFGYTFPVDNLAHGGVRLFPTQMIEVVFCFALFITMLILQKRWGDEKAYFTWPVFVLGYGSLRFFLDFMRGDISSRFLFLSTSQWVGLCTIIATLIWLQRQRIPSKKSAKI